MSPTNLGDDTPLHLAAAHNHRDLVCTVSHVTLLLFSHVFDHDMFSWYYVLFTYFIMLLTCLFEALFPISVLLSCDG